MGKQSFHDRMRNQQTIVKQNLQGSSAALLKQKQQQQPELYTQKSVPISKQLFEIIQLLRKEGKPLSSNDIIRKLAIDVMNTPDLFEAIKRNERIIVTDDTFEFKPTFNIKNKEDLLSLLKEHRGVMGMEVKELLNSFTGVVELINELELMGSVIVSKLKDGTPRVVYYNDPALNMTVSPEFVELWDKTTIPTDLDLQRELTKVGLKPVKVLKPKLEKGAALKDGKKKRRRTKFKVTNTHLQGVDLSKDVVLPQ